MNPIRQAPIAVNRRAFLGNTARNAAGVAVGVLSLGRGSVVAANESIQIGLIGCGEQGRELAIRLAGMKNVRLTTICDVDSYQAVTLQHALADRFDQNPTIVTRHEQVLEQQNLHAVIVATPDHWHAQMGIEACQAGKHLYLEQPVTHSLEEGQAILRAAQQAGVIVQTGLPQRSGTHFQSAVARIQSGELGHIHQAKAWAMHRRRQLPKSLEVPVPNGVDYTRWLGPASPQPYSSHHFHGNWPWFWDFGSGELGVWGVHLLDVVRWGLNLDLPTRVVCSGSNRALTDGRQTPDTLTAQFEFPDVDVTWEHRQWSHRGLEGRSAGVAFYGEKGTLVLDRSGWKVYDGEAGLFEDASELHSSHLQNWIQSIRTGQSPRASLEDGLKSVSMCHLANLAYRQEKEVRFNPQTQTVIS